LVPVEHLMLPPIPLYEYKFSCRLVQEGQHRNVSKPGGPCTQPFLACRNPVIFLSFLTNPMEVFQVSLAACPLHQICFMSTTRCSHGRPDLTCVLRDRLLWIRDSYSMIGILAVRNRPSTVFPCLLGFMPFPVKSLWHQATVDWDCHSDCHSSLWSLLGRNNFLYRSSCRLFHQRVCFNGVNI
jgi:hypothetical protein